MRKLSKVLSILMAMVLIFTTASIGVEAEYYAYKDTDLNYDSIDQPMLDPEHYASMAMDEIDRMLMKENIIISYEIFGMTLNADFTTVDKALDSVATVLNGFGKFLESIGGDIEQLNFDALCETWVDDGGTYHAVRSCPTRDASGYSDLDIFKALFQFLNDNAGIIAKVPKGSKDNGGLDLGALSSFVDLGDKLNVPELVKKALVKFIKASYDADKTLDEYVSDLLTQVLSGTYPKSGNADIYWVSQELQYYVPGIGNQIDFLNDSVYDVIEKVIRAGLDSQKAMDYINTTVQRWLHQFCGYAYIKYKDSNGKTRYMRDEENDDINQDYVNLVNLNFSLNSFNTSSWAANTTFVDHVNDILGKIVEAAFSRQAQITWDYTRGNNGLFANLRAAVEKVLEYTGSGLFASYVEVLPINQVRELTDDQFVAYILRSIMNGSIDAVYIQSNVDTTLGVLFETVRTLAGEVIPSQNYYNLSVSRDNMIQMGLDMAAAGLKGISSLEIPFGKNIDQFAKIAMDWVVSKYGGFVSGVTGEGWEAASDVFFTIIPANWLPYNSDGTLKDDLKSILLNDVVQKVLNFDLPALLNLASKNPDGELNGTIVEVLMARITSIVNYVIPNTFPAEEDLPEDSNNPGESLTYSKLETLINTDVLSMIIEGLLVNLYDRFDTLAPALLPVICSALGLSSPEEFGYPYVSLSDNTVLDPSATNTFYIYNGSSGINSAYTDKYGTTHRDELYSYRINSITVDNDDITVVTDAGKTPAGVEIPGGASRSFKFSDMSSATESVLTVTINYDVYGETGAKMTPSALTTTQYVYVSSNIDDSSVKHNLSKRDTNTSNSHVIYMPPCVYLKTGTKVSDLADIDFEIRRNPTGSSSSHSMKATVKPTEIVLDENLAAYGVTANTSYMIQTTVDGGSFEFHPYIVPEGSDDVLDDGLYTTTIYMFAGATQSTKEEWTLGHRMFVYNDYNLGSYLRSAVNSDRQAANYDTGSHTATYIPFDELANIPEDATQEDLEALQTTETVNGADAWEAYTTAVQEAVALVYAPRVWNTFSDSEGGTYLQFEDAARALYNATQELEACSVSSGAAGVKAALNAIVPDDTFVVTNPDGTTKLDEEGNEIRDTYEYNDARHTYFGRADYISYTYGRFKPERRAAERLINRWQDALKGKDVEPISAIEAAYATHRLNLYAGRLIRVRAYKEHLNKAINDYKSIFDGGKQSYSTESWTNFVTAYDFATTVNGMAIGNTISGSENLEGDGLRQTMVNEARGQLIKAAKKLVEAEEVDFTALNNAINSNRATYNAGPSNWTAASWAEFKTAYENAVTVAGNADATQAQVDAARQTLITKAAALEEKAEEGGIEFEEAYGELPPILIEETEDSGNKFMVGLNPDYLDSLEDFIVTSGGYTYEIIENETMGCFSTGAQLIVYDANGDEVVAYTLVLFGDVTGEGSADIDDALMLIAIANLYEMAEWQFCDYTDEYAESFAADVAHDGMIDISDAMLLIAQANFDEIINQNWTSYDDPDSFVP